MFESLFPEFSALLCIFSSFLHMSFAKASQGFQKCCKLTVSLLVHTSRNTNEYCMGVLLFIYLLIIIHPDISIPAITLLINQFGILSGFKSNYNKSKDMFMYRRPIEPFAFRFPFKLVSRGLSPGYLFLLL